MSGSGNIHAERTNVVCQAAGTVASAACQLRKTVTYG